MKTATKYLAEEILATFTELKQEQLQDILQKAEERFKTQILGAFNRGMINQMEVEMEQITNIKSSKTAEVYFEQTYLREKK